MEKSKGGRPSKYDKKMNEQVFKLCLLGATDAEIADFLGISVATFNNWKLKEPELVESLKRGKLDADSNVAKSLYRRAIDGEVTAQIFWLKNRQPSKWRDRKEHTEIQIMKEQLKIQLEKLEIEKQKNKSDVRAEDKIGEMISTLKEVLKDDK